MTVSRMVNCHLSLRAGEQEPLFNFGFDGRAVVRMDAYAIIPMEEYDHLRELAEIAADGMTRELLLRIIGARDE